MITRLVQVAQLVGLHGLATRDWAFHYEGLKRNARGKWCSGIRGRELWIEPSRRGRDNIVGRVTYVAQDCAGRAKEGKENSNRCPLIALLKQKTNQSSYDASMRHWDLEVAVLALGVADQTFDIR